ncbi:MAG: hypothetical protein KBA06_04575, partial [Saprospiraceae bacterium]|nr:hypothetical protein [Saprospiraceae bacterium]
ADGFSFPYQFCIGFGMLLYAFLGVFLLRKILLKYFSDTTVAILLLSYVIGTNYLDYSSIDQAMTHNVLFTFYCALILATISFYENPTNRKAIGIGSLVGLMTLIRPTEIISCIIPLLWGINSFEEIPNRINFIFKNIPKFLLMGIMGIIFISIQMIYWKYVANEWVVYSYEDQGFSWLHPHVYDYMLSYRSGWLRFTPMMILALIGILFYFKSGNNRLAILSFIFINFYIIMAWDMWDYSGASGRAMIQSYPLLAFPFCLLIEKARNTNWKFYALLLVILFCTYINIWWTYHLHNGNIQTFNLTKEYYWKVIGRWDESDENKKLLDNMYIYEGNPSNYNVLYSNDFSRDTSANATKDSINNKIKINKDLQYSADYTIQHTSAVKKWIRASAEIYCNDKEWDFWKSAQFRLFFKNKSEVVQENVIRIHRFINNGETKEIYIDTKVPQKDWDSLAVSFWNSDGDKELVIDNLKVISFDE